MFFLDTLKLIFFETRQNKLRKVQVKKQINRLSLTKTLKMENFTQQSMCAIVAPFLCLPPPFCQKENLSNNVYAEKKNRYILNTQPSKTDNIAYYS